jgi:hypothetical protein
VWLWRGVGEGVCLGGGIVSYYTARLLFAVKTLLKLSFEKGGEWELVRMGFGDEYNRNGK